MNEALQHSDSRRARRWAMGASLGAALLMLAGKTVAAVLTGSTAIYSDAAESVVHLFATGFAAFSLWYAATPPDPNHPYGHGKIAYFAAGIEGGLILVAAASIGYSAVLDFLRGPTLARLDTGLLIIGVLTAVNFGLGRLLIRTGRRHQSLILVSNGQHVMTDMWTSLGVLVGVGLVRLTGIAWIDPVVALLVAANIVRTAVGLLRRSAHGLMERANPDATQAILDELASAVEEEVISGFHQVRHRRVNDQVWVEYHLQFPGDRTIEEAHARSHRVENRIDALFPDDKVNVTAHLEPRAHHDAHPDDHEEPDDPLYDVIRKAGSVRREA
jgi:cation diffusion facilitator family transporter